MQKLFDLAIEMILIFDIKGRILEGNRAAKEQLLYFDGFENSNIWQIFREDSRMLGKRVFFVNDLGSEHVTGEDEDQLIGEYETVAFRKDGTWVPVFRRIFVLSENGIHKGVSVSVDIGVEKEAVRQLVYAEKLSKEATKVRDQFAANITHELRTPINGIMDHARSIRNAPLTKEQDFSLNMIEKSLKTMNEMINNLLDYSKLSAGKFRINPEPLRIRRLITDLLLFHAPSIRQKGLKLYVRISQKLPEWLCADEVALSQILNNLLYNAIKFTPQGQIRVDVAVKEEKDRFRLEFAVADTGIGIRADQIDQIFVSFMQLDASATRRYGGSGLGLSIVKQLVELMGGRIQVESVLEEGTTFRFFIYAKKEEREKTEEEKLILPEGWFVFDEDKKDMVREMVKLQTLQENEQEGQEKTQGKEPDLPTAASEKERLRYRYAGLRQALEAENWEQAELLLDMLKRLVSEAPEDYRQKFLRLELEVRKENRERAQELLELLEKR